MKRNIFFPRGIRRPIYAPTVGEWLCMCLGILAACAALWFFAGCTAPTAPAPLVPVFDAPAGQITTATEAEALASPLLFTRSELAGFAAKTSDCVDACMQMGSTFDWRSCQFSDCIEFSCNGADETTPSHCDGPQKRHPHNE